MVYAWQVMGKLVQYSSQGRSCYMHEHHCRKCWGNNVEIAHPCPLWGLKPACSPSQQWNPMTVSFPGQRWTGSREGKGSARQNWEDAPEELGFMVGRYERNGVPLRRFWDVA